MNTSSFRSRIGSGSSSTSSDDRARRLEVGKRTLVEDGLPASGEQEPNGRGPALPTADAVRAGALNGIPTASGGGSPLP